MMKFAQLLKALSTGLLALLLVACAQAPLKDSDATPQAAADAAPAAIVDQAPEATGPLKPLAWLEGCWKGSVNQRDYREHWLPLRGEMMLGASHTVVGDRTQDYQFLRMEVRDDAVYYVIASPNEKEHRFKLSGETTDKEDTIYAFNNVEDAFPQTLS
ncbi:MAG: DUF6265 family protein, partial [Burkholderiales bacterium]|nr:DUF6265 family protein [Burkholderiales bacterium]